MPPRSPFDDRVAEPVAAGVPVELTLGRLPARVPVVAAVVVADVQEAAADVERRVVVAIPDQPPQPGVAVERVPAGGVGDERDVVLAAQVVDPRQRRVRARDDVFPSIVVEVAVAHPRSPLSGFEGPGPVADGPLAEPTCRRPSTTTPRMNARWAIRKMKTGTIIARTADAWISVGWLAYRALYCWIPIDSGCSSGLLARYSKRHEEVVPGEEEVEQGDGRDRRDGLRDDDRAQDPERARRRRSSPPRRGRAGSS